VCVCVLTGFGWIRIGFSGSCEFVNELLDCRESW